MTSVLVDTSVWMRRSQTEVARILGDTLEAGLVLMSPMIELELLRTARSARELSELAFEYGDLARVGVGDEVERRALEIQTSLARRGFHRGPSPVDLIAAATAEHAQAELWHCDRHFELIADVTGQRVRRIGE